MTIEEAQGLIGAWVRTKHTHGGGGGAAGKLGGQLVGVKGHKLLVKLPGNKEPAERDPGDVHIWKSRTVQSGIKIDKPATPIKPTVIAPEIPVVPVKTADIFAEFETAKAELDQWAELEKSCRDDLEQAKIGYETANGRVSALRKELKARIDF